MANFPVNNTEARVQITATGGQTTFTYNFEIFEVADLAVYLTPNGQTPDPNTDILVLTTDYTVTGAGTEGGGTIVLTAGSYPSGATAGDVITIIRNLPFDRLTDYSTGGEITASSLNVDLDKDVMRLQQLRSRMDDRMLTYEETTQTTTGDTVLPKLGNLQYWQKNSAGKIVAATLEEDPNVTTLRSELASQTISAPGTDLIGYYDSNEGGMDLTTKLFRLQGLAFFHSGATLTLTDANNNQISLLDASSNNIAVNLPAVSTLDGSAGSFVVTLKRLDSSANTITIQTPDAATIDGSATSTIDIQYESVVIAFYSSNWYVISSNYQQGDTSSFGVWKGSTQALMEAASDSTTCATPDVIKYSPSSVKAFVNYNLSSSTIIKSHNVSGVVRDGVGTFTATFTNNMADANYLVVAGVQDLASANPHQATATTKTTSTVQVKCWDNGNTLFDGQQISVVVYGDLA